MTTEMKRLKKAKAEAGNLSIKAEVAVEVFCHAVMHGRTMREAYLLSHPKSSSENPKSISVEATHYSQKPDVQKRLNEMKAEMREKHSKIRDQLVEMLWDEIIKCYDSKKSLFRVLEQVKVLAKILGLNTQNINIQSTEGVFDREVTINNLVLMAREAKKRG